MLLNILLIAGHFCEDEMTADHRMNIDEVQIYDSFVHPSLISNNPCGKIINNKLIII